MTAIYYAGSALLEMIEGQNLLIEGDITVRVDNQAAIHTMANEAKKDGLAVHSTRVWNQIAKHARKVKKKVKICWVKAHVGTEGNEKADTLAKEGAEMEPSALFRDEKTAKNQIKRAMRKKWQEEWKRSPSCQQTKIWFKEGNSALSRGLLDLPRGLLGRLIGIITDFNKLRRHLSKLEPGTPTSCRLCATGEKEDMQHLVFKCQATQRAAMEHLGQFCTNAGAWTVEGLTAFVRTDLVAGLLD